MGFASFTAQSAAVPVWRPAFQAGASPGWGQVPTRSTGRFPFGEPLDGVDEGTRTPNHRNHNPVLCH